MDSFESWINPWFLAGSEKEMLWEPRVIESERETVGGFKEDEKGKRRACFVVVQFELIFGHPCVYIVCTCTEFFSEVGHFTERSGFLELCVIWEKLMVYRVVSYDMGERCSVQDEENGPQYWTLKHTIHKLWWWRRRVIYWSGLMSVWEIWLKPLECSRLNAKNRVQAGEKNLLVSCPERREYHLQYVTKRSGAVSCSTGWLKGVAEVVFFEMGERLFQGFRPDRNGRLQTAR